MRARLLPLILIAFLPSSLFAWGEKGHYIVNEAATYAVPTELPSFFHRAYPELIYLAYDPDRWRGAGASLEAFNPPNHFLDFEYVQDLKLPPSRYAYLELLQKSGTLRRFSIPLDKPGFLPWEIAERAELLTVQWRLWRASMPGSIERRQIEQNIIFIAGTLGHFAGDSANPHHATMNYNGWVEDNPKGFATDCDTHVRFEADFINHAMDVRDVVPKLAPPAFREDFFAAALAQIAESKGQLEQLYTIDRDGGFAIHEGTPEAREFTAERLAAGASFIRDLWWSAWLKSAKR